MFVSLIVFLVGIPAVVSLVYFSEVAAYICPIFIYEPEILDLYIQKVLSKPLALTPEKLAYNALNVALEGH
jgi:hypothetical protein